MSFAVHRAAESIPVYEDAMAERTILEAASLPPNELTMKYRYKDCDSTLSEIIALPKITGTAVVVAFGNEMECIRSIGDAPSIGCRSYAGLGLTGTCVSSGKVQLCNDVENDSRADLQACADLGVRSVLVVPIQHSSRVAGVLEALSSQPNAFDWRTIRQVRRVARAFDPVTLEPYVQSPGTEGDEFEQPASPSVGSRNTELDLQKLLCSAWLIQNRSGALTPSALEYSGQTFNEAQPDYRQPRRVFSAVQPIEDLSSLGCTDPSAFGTRGDAVPRFLPVDKEYSGKARPQRFVGLGIAIFILFICFFQIRTHLTSLSALFGRPPIGSSLSSAAVSREGVRNRLPSESAAEGDVSVKKPAPTVRTATPQSSAAGLGRKVKKAEENDDAEASWHLALAYLKGVGVQKDEREAAKWLKRGANLGDSRAQASLSDLYVRGIGVQRDYVRAYTWATIAAGQVGGEDERLAFLRRRLTSSELKDANRRVHTWFTHNEYHGKSRQ